MSKKLLFLMSFVLLLSPVTSVWAYDTVIWDNQNGAGDRLWSTAMNWTIDAKPSPKHEVPTSDDWVIIDELYTEDGNGPIIQTGINAVCDWLDMGYYSLPIGEDAVLTMTGGTLTSGNYIAILRNAAGSARFDLSGGDVNAGGDFYLTDGASGSTATVNMSGGTIAVGEDIEMGNYGTDVGIFNMSGGSIDVADQIYIGFYSPNPSTFNITGGTINVFELHIGNTWGDTPVGAGHLKLYGGTINAEDLAIGGEGDSSVDITDGVLIVDTDVTVPNGYIFNPGVDSHGTQPWTGTVPIVIAKGLITAYDTNSGDIITDEVNYPGEAGLRAVVNVDYGVTNPGKTTISASAVDPNLAWNPNPSAGGGGLLATEVTSISWSAGDNAASHDVYFGTSFAEVSGADTSSGAYKGNQVLADVNYPVSVVWGEDYYWRIDEVNGSHPGAPWTGIVWSFATAPAWATNPSPQDGAEGVSLSVVLSWTPGPEAATHELYFSTDYNDVNGRLITPAAPGANSYNPGALEFTTTYYWAVDEVNLAAEVNVWPGAVWDFTTADHLVVEDFNSYASNNELYAVWDDYWTNGTGSEIFIEKDPDLVYEGNSLAFYYDNANKKQIGSRIDADTVDLEIGSNWSIGGAQALRLQFAGLPGNSATAQDKMWVELEDTSSNKGVVRYDGDPNDVKEENWHEWNIDLGIFDACGVSLSNVAKVHMGFGGLQGGQDKVAGGTGWVYFDLIEAWPPLCRSEMVPADITGDCVTNTDDLEILAADWLLYDYNFIAAEPCEANLIGWWKLDEGSGTIAVDSSIYNNDGNIIEATWTTGYPNDPCDSALDFAGDGAVTFDHVLCAERVNDVPGIYPAELMPNKFTVTCWTRLDSFSYFSSFVGNGMDTGADECGFFFYNYGWNYPADPWVENFGLAIRTEAGMYYVETPDVYKTKTWYHLAATYDGNYASVYVDGLLAAGPEDVGGPMRWISADSGNYPERFTIGVWQDPGYRLYVKGIIDEVRYYNVPLSQGDIAVLAEIDTAGQSVYQPVPSLANITDPEPPLSRKVNFNDYGIIADNWLVGPVYWP